MSNSMLRLLFRYTTLMYHRIACRIRHHFAPKGLMRFYGYPSPVGSQGPKDLIQTLCPLTANDSYYVVRIEFTAFHPTFWVSHSLRELTYSRIKLYYFAPS